MVLCRPKNFWNSPPVPAACWGRVVSPTVTISSGGVGSKAPSLWGTALRPHESSSVVQTHLAVPQVDPASSRPLLPLWRQAREAFLEKCLLNHSATLIYIIISSAVYSQREETSYKTSPEIHTYAQSRPQRKIVFAAREGASVANVDSPVTEMAADASANWQLEKPPRPPPRSRRDLQGFCFLKTAFFFFFFKRERL